MFGPESGKNSWANLTFQYEVVRVRSHPSKTPARADQEGDVGSTGSLSTLAQRALFTRVPCTLSWGLVGHVGRLADTCVCSFVLITSWNSGRRPQSHGDLKYGKSTISSEDRVKAFLKVWENEVRLLP